MTSLAFTSFSLNGAEAQKFLQGQVTINVENLDLNITRYTGICSLKGRLQFGLWLTKITAESFEIVATADQADALATHIKKYGAFSKMKLEAGTTVFPRINGIHTDFAASESDIDAWQLQAIETGQAWITAESAEVFQPQELRLHQREGVHYDKGCYLGQEVVARLWFKAKPKQWLHLVLGGGEVPAPTTKLVNSIQVVISFASEVGFKALVVAKPEALAEFSLTVLDLPAALNGDVARPQ